MASYSSQDVYHGHDARSLEVFSDLYQLPRLAKEEWNGAGSIFDDLLCDQDDLYMPGVMASAMTAPGRESPTVVTGPAPQTLPAGSGAVLQATASSTITGEHPSSEQPPADPPAIPPDAPLECAEKQHDLVSWILDRELQGFIAQLVARGAAAGNRFPWPTKIVNKATSVMQLMGKHVADVSINFHGQTRRGSRCTVLNHLAEKLKDERGPLISAGCLTACIKDAAFQAVQALEGEEGELGKTAHAVTAEMERLKGTPHLKPFLLVDDACRAIPRDVDAASHAFKVVQKEVWAACNKALVDKLMDAGIRIAALCRDGKKAQVQQAFRVFPTDEKTLAKRERATDSDAPPAKRRAGAAIAHAASAEGSVSAGIRQSGRLRDKGRPSYIDLDKGVVDMDST